MKELAQLIGVGLLAVALLTLEEYKMHLEAAENHRRAGAPNRRE